MDRRAPRIAVPLALATAAGPTAPARADGTVAPSPAPVTNVFPARGVTVVGGPDELTLTILDAHGEHLGELALWFDGGQFAYLASDYQDGGALLRIDLADGHVDVVDHDLPLSVIANRASMIQALLVDQVSATDERPSKRGPDNSLWFACALDVAIAVGACAGTVFNPWLGPGCFGTTAKATCQCISAWAEKQGKRKCELS